MQLLSGTRKSSSSADCAAEVLEVVPPIHWVIRRQMRGHRAGLSLPQFRSLVRIDRQPDASLSALAEHLGASLPTASRLVAGLVDKGYLVREASRKDRRKLSLAITSRGRAMLQTARRATREYMEGELNSLNVGQRAAVVKALEILKTIFAPLSRSEVPAAGMASRKTGRRNNRKQARVAGN